jgi:glycosyltransferase involved in cell wall biosynthesis/GT2 family glycosyltransferase
MSKEFSGLRAAVVTAGPATGVQGGAERFYIGLMEGLREIGFEVELVPVPASEPDFETILDNYERARAIDLSGYDLVVSSKVPTYAVRHPNHVMFLNHTVRVFDDMFDQNFPDRSAEACRQRARIHAVDLDALLQVKSRFAQGHEVSRRLYRWRGLECEVLHPPLGFNAFRHGEAQDYFFVPGRLHKWKRFDLVIEAIRRSTEPMRLIIAGTGEHEDYYRSVAGGDPRIEFRGRIDDDELVSLYSGAVAIPFVAVREDYGYVTLEAFASGKPVLTCTDSGEPCHFVRQFETGLIAEPDPESVRKALEWLWTNRDEASRMGVNGHGIVESMSWRATATALARAGLGPAHAHPARHMKVAVLDMQPIDPPTGGGRLRLLGLYHNLGADSTCRYVGTYDWPGEKYRAHPISRTLFEIDVPLSDEHHAAAADLAKRAGGKGVIDLAFSQQALLSPKYVEAARREAARADVVVFSHPWVYPLVKDCLRPNQVVVYESHNVEGYLRAQLLDSKNPVEEQLLRQVAQDENDLGQRADWILACSHEDLLRFHRVYGFPPDKMRIAPNGVMAFQHDVPTDESRRAARQSLGLAASGRVAVFIGSGYGPNTDAAEFICRDLAPRLPDVTFVIAGGVGETVRSDRSNVVVTGLLDEAAKIRWFHASDIALNPMRSGSGTNIKMFDFMAMALPVVTTAIGARGIDCGGRDAMLVVAPTVDAFVDGIGVLRDPDVRRAIGAEARRCVEDSYAWERISAQLGTFLHARKRLAGQTRPFFSVVVPSYERHDQLDALMGALQAQVERDFEVVIVDQSAAQWAQASECFGFPVVYQHSPVKGAVRARNTGAMLAQGRVLAFVDDDCLPEPEWLLHGRRYFDEPDVVALEGRIVSDHLDDAEWRPVTNVGFEGIGFMTANLMVRSSVFQYLGGFDLQFDHPHFREDTDLGWRLQDLGAIPYAADVTVFHPAQPRSKERESAVTRVKFFRKDALLYAKHPERYRELFLREGHFLNTAGFAEHLLAGFAELGKSPEDLPAWMKEAIRA